jgi:hypothetical protein
MPELAAKNVAMKRRGRLYRAIVRGLSSHTMVQLAVPEAVWSIVADGWLSGPLVKSSSGIPDPDYPTVRWRAWMFLNGTVILQSTVNPAYIRLANLAAEARSNPADTPTRGL